MFQTLLIVSRVIGALIGIILVANAIYAILRVGDTADRYVRVSFGFAGLSMLIARIRYLVPGTNADAWWWLEMIEIALFVIAIVRLVRAYQKYPSAKLTLNLFTRRP